MANNSSIRGTYKNGKFYSYNPKNKGIISKINTKNTKILNLIKEGKIVHGKYLNKKFTPFIKKEKTIYIPGGLSPKKQTLLCEYNGKLFKNKKFIAGILPSGIIVSAKDFKEIIKGSLSY